MTDAPKPMFTTAISRADFRRNYASADPADRRRLLTGRRSYYDRQQGRWMAEPTPNAYGRTR